MRRVLTAAPVKVKAALGRLHLGLPAGRAEGRQLLNVADGKAQGLRIALAGEHHRDLRSGNAEHILVRLKKSQTLSLE